MPTCHRRVPFCFRDDAIVDIDPSSALAGVSDRLRCPHCGAEPLRCTGRTVRCAAGHSFDVARQGYVSLLTGDRRRHRGDDPAMVAARERFLARDHYRPLRSTLTALAAEHAPPAPDLAVDVAGGTGHYLAAVLDALTGHRGLTTDLSGAALRRAARAHPRAAAAAADAWRELPLRSGAAGVVLSVFGPRNVDEIERVLTGDGVLVLAVAGADHLRELRGLAGTIGVDPRKHRRLGAALRGFDAVARQPVTWRMALGPDEVRELVTMGPSHHHADRRALDRLPDLVGVTASIDVAVLRRRR